jgi:hypothetical protein
VDAIATLHGRTPLLFVRFNPDAAFTSVEEDDTVITVKPSPFDRILMLKCNINLWLFGVLNPTKHLFPERVTVMYAMYSHDNKKLRYALHSQMLAPVTLITNGVLIPDNGVTVDWASYPGPLEYGMLWFQRLKKVALSHAKKIPVWRSGRFHKVEDVGFGHKSVYTNY